MLFSRDKKYAMLAQQTGRAIVISEVPDPVFSNKVLGDGIAIIPISNEVYSPVCGLVAQIAHTFHAIGIESDDGLEILVHLGIDTVKLNGEGFTCYVEAGQHVSAGDILMDMDLEFIKSQGYNVISPCIVTNMDEVKSFEFKTGDVTGGKTAVMTYKK